MRHFDFLTKVVAFLVIIHTTLPHTVHAYLDPGTGSYLLQLAIAAILAGLYSVKLFWKNIKSFFQNVFSRGKNGKKTKDY